MTDRQPPPSPGSRSPEDPAGQTSQTDQNSLTGSQTGQTRAEARAARPWFKRKRIAFPSAVLLVFLIIMISTGGNDPGFLRSTTDAVASRVKSVTRSTPTIATIGQSVRDGRFSFVVTSTQRPSRTITDRLGHTQTAQGEFVIVRVDVTNIGYDARTLTATGQFLVNNLGKRYATSSAISGLRGAESILTEKINPGQTVNNAPLLFDVPTETTIAGVELHDSLTSDGVTVALP